MQVNSPEVELPRNIIQVQEEKKFVGGFTFSINLKFVVLLIGL